MGNTLSKLVPVLCEPIAKIHRDIITIIIVVVVIVVTIIIIPDNRTIARGTIARSKSKIIYRVTRLKITYRGRSIFHAQCRRHRSGSFNFARVLLIAEIFGERVSHGGHGVGTSRRVYRNRLRRDSLLVQTQRTYTTAN